MLILVFYRRGIKRENDSGRIYNLTKDQLNTVYTYTLHVKSI